MAVQTHDTLDDLERRRLELEDNVRKLRQSLYNWRLWEAEYDGLKDELKGLDQDCTSAEILRVGIDFEGTVVDEKEVKALIGVGQGVGITRSRDQVVQQISRRLDYVKQNVASIEKRLATAENNLDRLLSIERPGPNAATEDYAVTEIFEELDENGEVIASKVSTPADHAPEIIDVLKKAGVEIPQVSKPKEQVESNNKVDEKDKNEAEKQGSRTEEAPAPVTVQAETLSARNTAITTAETNSDVSDESGSESEPTSEVDESPDDAKLRREMLEYSFREVGKVVAELEMDEGSDISYDDDDYDDDEYEDEEEDEYGRTTSTVLTEEYHQQMKELEEKLQAGGFVNLGPARNMPAEAMSSAEEAARAGVLKVATIEQDSNKESSPEEDKKKPKKKVAFAQELDIAPESKPAKPSAPPMLERKIDAIKPDVTPLSESIVERSTSKASPNIKDTNGTVPTKKKASRFKSARNDGTPTPGDSSTPGIGSSTKQQSILKKSDQAPTTSSISLFPARPKEPKPFSQPIIASGDVFSAAKSPPSTHSEPQPPEGKVSADTLIERPPVADIKNVLPPDPDEIDEEIHRKEVASEFYHRRNLKIQQSGGFLKNDDEDEHVQGELYELDENDQPKRRVSRFKAARIRP